MGNITFNIIGSYKPFFVILRDVTSGEIISSKVIQTNIENIFEDIISGTYNIEVYDSNSGVDVSENITIAPTTTAPTTTLAPSLPINNNNVFGSGFANSTDGLYGYLGTDVWNEVDSGNNISVGDIIFQPTNNNTSIRDNGDGTYELFVNATLKLTNNTNFIRNVLVPRISFNIGDFITNPTHLESSFIPDNATKKVVLFTENRIVAEFNDQTISPNSVINLNVNGSIVISTNGDIISNIVSIYGSNTNVNFSEYTVESTFIGNTLVKLKNVGGNLVNFIDVIMNTLLVEPVQITPTENLKNVGHILLTNDSLIPPFYVESGNTNGIVTQNIEGVPTTTEAPLTANLEVQTNSFNNLTQTWKSTFSSTIDNVTISTMLNEINIGTLEFNNNSRDINLNISLLDNLGIIPNDQVEIIIYKNDVEQYRVNLIENNQGSVDYTYLNVSNNDLLSVNIRSDNVNTTQPTTTETTTLPVFTTIGITTTQPSGEGGVDVVGGELGTIV